MRNNDFGPNDLTIETSFAGMSLRYFWPTLCIVISLYLFIATTDAHWSKKLTLEEALIFLVPSQTVLLVVFLLLVAYPFRTVLRLSRTGELLVEFVYIHKSLFFEAHSNDIVAVAAVSSEHSEAENIYALRVSFKSGLPLAIRLPTMQVAVCVSEDICRFLDNRFAPVLVEYIEGVTRGKDPLQIYSPTKWLRSVNESGRFTSECLPREGHVTTSQRTSRSLWLCSSFPDGSMTPRSCHAGCSRRPWREEFLAMADLEHGGCVILDLRMLPGMTGEDVFGELRKRQSPFVVLVLSGDEPMAPA